LRHAVHPNVTVVGDVPENLPLSPIADHCLTQAVLNLVTNSSDAIGTSRPGKITVSARYEDGWLSLKVTDNGPGMTEDVRRRCTEPFFTTKPLTVSTGLGLAMVHNLAVKAGGRIEVASTMGGGTTISMFMLAKFRVHDSVTILSAPPTVSAPQANDSAPITPAASLEAAGSL
jgi:signal transduction histidine kinase